MRILMVDDDPDICRQIESALLREGYDVDTAFDGGQALDCLFDGSYDLVILDIMLPLYDGMEVLRHIRKAGMIMPVILLTARGAVKDRVYGLDEGADDYLAKPFAMAELMARIRALLRRNMPGKALLSSGALVLDTAGRQAWCNDVLLKLTPKEFAILEFLLYNAGRVVSRFTLAEHVWGDAYDPFTMSNFIDVHIKNLRCKLRNTGCTGVVLTVRGVGFVIRKQPS